MIKAKVGTRNHFKPLDNNQRVYKNRDDSLKTIEYKNLKKAP
jgi:hypothetical protein